MQHKMLEKKLQFFVHAKILLKCICLERMAFYQWSWYSSICIDIENHPICKTVCRFSKRQSAAPIFIDDLWHKCIDGRLEFGEKVKEKYQYVEYSSPSWS